MSAYCHSAAELKPAYPTEDDLTATGDESKYCQEKAGDYGAFACMRVCARARACVCVCVCVCVCSINEIVLVNKCHITMYLCSQRYYFTSK